MSREQNVPTLKIRRQQDEKFGNFQKFLHFIGELTVYIIYLVYINGTIISNCDCTTHILLFLADWLLLYAQNYKKTEWKTV